MVTFDQLPPNARVWVFASDRPLRGDDAAALLRAVDRFLEHWKAHGAPLRCARDWRDDRFLVIGVDPSAEQASGCSIDGLFRSLQVLERELHTRLVAGGRVFYRGSDAEPKLVARADVPKLVARGELTDTTPVYDTSITDAGRLRRDFERPARETWVASLFNSTAQRG